MSSWIIEELARQRRLDLLREAERERLVASARKQRTRAARRLVHRLHVMRRKVTTAAAPIPGPERRATASVGHLPVPRDGSADELVCEETASPPGREDRPLDHAAGAHALVEQGGLRGRVVLTPDPSGPPGRRTAS